MLISFARKFCIKEMNPENSSVFFIKNGLRKIVVSARFPLSELVLANYKFCEVIGLREPFSRRLSFADQS